MHETLLHAPIACFKIIAQQCVWRLHTLLFVRSPRTSYHSPPYAVVRMLISLDLFYIPPFFYRTMYGYVGNSFYNNVTRSLLASGREILFILSMVCSTTITNEMQCVQSHRLPTWFSIIIYSITLACKLCYEIEW
jgi:hypothetical protein